MSIQDPGNRPTGWGVAGDHERRIRALEALEQCCDQSGGERTIADIIRDNPCAISYWPMNDTGPGIVDAIDGNDLDENPTGVVTGQPVSSQGAYSFAYQQTGPYADAPSVFAIQFDGDASGASSFGTCLFRNGLVDTLGAGSFSIIGWAYNDTDPALRIPLSIWGGATGGAQTVVAVGGFGVNTGSGSFTANALGSVSASAWRFLTAVYDAGAAEISFYLDGVFQATTAIVGTPVANGYWRFGCAGTGSGGPTNFFKGRLSNWAAFNCALTADEITELFGAGGSGDVQEGMVRAADGLGGTEWAYPTVGVDAPETRFNTLNLGSGLAGTDEGDGSLTIDAVGPPAGAAGGDLGGTYPNPTVENIESDVLGAGTAGPGTFLSGDRTWQPVTVDPADDTSVWLPLTTTVGGDDVLVFDADHSLIPTLVPL